MRLCLALGWTVLSCTWSHGAPAVVVTGRPLDANGQTQVPRGLMGLHADIKLTPELVSEWGVESFRQIHYIPGSSSIAWDKEGNVRDHFKQLAVVVDCQGDRFVPALPLTDPNFKQTCERLGRQYAQKCKDLNWPGHAELWNEPYLNWAQRSRKNYDPKFYDVSRAVDEGPVTVKGWPEPLRHLRWRRLWAADDNGKIIHMVPVPRDAKPGDKITHRFNLYFMPRGEQTYTVVEKWDVYDPTEVSFWSGKQNYDFYMWMLIPWAKAIKQTNPSVQVIAGWDFPVSFERWKAWELLYKPMIDESIEWIDGVCEHHYGLDSRVNTTTYEVVVGYAMAQHGKRLRCYNTETAGCVDPAVPGNKHGNATPYGAFNYGLRDIIELIYRSPDKAVARASHGSKTPGWGGGGDEFLFKLLKDLRGPLVHCTSDDLGIWPVASVNNGKLVAVLYNDRPEKQTVHLTVKAPPGMQLGDGATTWVEPTAEQGPLRFRQEPAAAAGDRADMRVDLPPHTGAKLVFPLSGTRRPGGIVIRRQFFAKGVLKRVSAQQPLAMEVALPEEMLRGAGNAFVRVALEGARNGEASVKVNEATVKLPDRDWLIEVPVDLKALGPRNTLTFECAGDGYQVDVASLVLEAHTP